MANVPKKNNLFFIAAPPRLPPKSFKWNLGFSALLASFTQLFAFNAEFRWSSKSRPWNVLLPLRVTKLTWKFDCPNPVFELSWSVWTVISCMSSMRASTRGWEAPPNFIRLVVAITPSMLFPVAASGIPFQVVWPPLLTAPGTSRDNCEMSRPITGSSSTCPKSISPVMAFDVLSTTGVCSTTSTTAA